MGIETVDRRDASGLNDLGLTLAAQERFDDAIEQYRKATALWGTTGSPDRKFALCNWAEALRSKKLYEESARKYGEAIVVDPKFAPAYNGLGLALAGQERFDAAIEQYRKAAALWEATGSPDRKLALCNWAEALGSKNLYEKAAKKYGEAIAVDPNYAPAYNGLGFALAGQERFDDAIEQYRKAAALWESTGSPDRKFALRYWAKALRLKKLYEESAKKCGEAIAVDVNFALAYNDLGLALAGQERFDEAIEQYRKAVALLGSTGLPTGSLRCSTGPTPCVRRSSTRSRQRSAAKPSPSIRILRALTTVLASRWRTRSASTKRSSNIAQAAALWETTGSPDRKFALYNWADALVSKKLYEEAAKKCGEAIAVDPNFADAHQRSWPRVGGPGALRRSDRAISHRPRRCGSRPGLPTGSLRCSTGPAPWS